MVRKPTCFIITKVFSKSERHRQIQIYVRRHIKTGDGKYPSPVQFLYLTRELLLYMPSWKVREITSSCCSFVSLIKFTA